MADREPARWPFPEPHEPSKVGSVAGRAARVGRKPWVTWQQYVVATSPYCLPPGFSFIRPAGTDRPGGHGTWTGSPDPGRTCSSPSTPSTPGTVITGTNRKATTPASRSGLPVPARYLYQSHLPCGPASPNAILSTTRRTSGRTRSCNAGPSARQAPVTRLGLGGSRRWVRSMPSRTSTSSPMDGLRSRPRGPHWPRPLLPATA